MLKLNQVKVPLGATEDHIKHKINKLLMLHHEELQEFTILKHSIDARKEPVSDVYQIAVSLKNEENIYKKISSKQKNIVSKYEPIPYDFYHKIDHNVSRMKQQHRPVIIGAGPAGLFCAYELAKHGYMPLVFERGKCVEERQKDVEEFFQTGLLNPNSNVQFGEGGAGAFSDGKLNTLVKDTFGRSQYILQTFVECGANEDILYENKPHIGTDVLHHVLIKLRKRILALGGEIHFETQITEFLVKNNAIIGVKTNQNKIISCDVCILAIGHSARDTFETLNNLPIHMEAKSFAVGFRVEHPQEMINQIQYKKASELLPAAPYKVTATTSSGRGVYSFCMCPGGYVVNASSVKGQLAVNGMSYRARDGKNANSAIIVSVTPDDYPDKSTLAGVHFQEILEQKAYALGKGCIPQQLFMDFEKNQPSTSYGSFTSCTKGNTQFANLREIMPEKLNQAFIEGMHQIGEKIPDFDRNDAILSGIESRTSSPIRITRNGEFQSSIAGIYPCGEGAGYAGGIMSAAIDGLKVAEMIGATYEVAHEEK